MADSNASSQVLQSLGTAQGLLARPGKVIDAEEIDNLLDTVADQLDDLTSVMEIVEGNRGMVVKLLSLMLFSRAREVMSFSLFIIIPITEPLIWCPGKYMQINDQEIFARRAFIVCCNLQSSLVA